MSNLPTRAVGPADRVSGPSVSVSSPTPSRRAAIGALTCGVLIASRGLAAATPAEGADGPLLALCDELERLIEAERAAEAHFAACFDRYGEQEPAPSAVLRRTLKDHTSLALPFDREEAGPIYGDDDADLNSFYTAQEVGRLRYAPPPWDLRDLPEQRARVAGIEQAFERWSDERRARRNVCGVDDALDMMAAVSDERAEIGDQIAATAAQTPAGLQRKAEMVRLLRGGAPVVVDPGMTNEEAIAASIVRDLLA